MPHTDPLAAPTDADSAPLPPAGAASTLEDQLATLQRQMTALLAIQQGTAQALAGVVHGGATGVTDEQLTAVAAAVPMPEAKPMATVRILLEDNDNIPPGGQFISVDGLAYLLQPNVEVDVPSNLLDVLDNATYSVPITDADKNVIGYRDRLRFPYRTVRDRSPQTIEE